MGRIRRRLLQRQADRLGDLVVPDPTRRSRSRLVIQTLDPALGKPTPPLAHRVLVRRQRSSNRLVLYAVSRSEHDPGSTS
jgi:hypothetical protein